ncbi:glycosyltransferase family 4 protein, partial [Escherichia coli]|nr:glycosyltransferase family 4 protein [Escherichia coli]EJZ3076547.1 glycosyltransferase family 4 protein [Escherichia coli]EKD1076528.1 glycosyltransferase family 4 protein [Escherichia coli]
MKILLLSNMYPSEKEPSFGIFVETIANQLSDIGYDVELCVRKRKCKGRISKLLSYMLFYIRAFLYLNFKKYDYIYCHYVSHISLPVICAIFLGRRLRVISHVHGGDVKYLKGRSFIFHKIKNVFTVTLFKHSLLILCPSQQYAKYLCEHYNINISKVIVYPSGGVKKCFKYETFFPVHDESVKIGFAGRLVKSKNVDLIINAIKQLKNVQLSIVGDGEQKDYLYKLAKDCDIEFLGPMNHNELARWYKTINVLVYPSESESLGLVPLEAMSSGVYCILSKIPAFYEIRQHGLTFSFIENYDSQSIAREIENFQKINITHL